MKRLLLVILCVLALPVMASHIVGGEFEIVYLSGNTYRINLIIYFDKLNGQPGAKDAEVQARIFRKRDNAFVMNVLLPRREEENVSYTQPECSNGEIQTEKLTYSNTVTMSAAQFGDPEGYYIVWERCCRNYSITNIVSNEPPPGVSNATDAAGQTFYLEFPPVVKGGKPFINSSPRLFPPLNDYACPFKPYYADFAGVDDDGDSLVYSLSVPLNTHTSTALPPLGPAPAPYPVVRWRSGFGINNIIGGNPDLKITREGLLTVTPQQQGLYVFAVKCEEFREGKKIGELRRDFQMLVVDRCPVATPPQILGKKLTDASFTYDESMSVTFNNTVSDQDRCIKVQVSDSDALRAEEFYRERIQIKAVPIGFRKDVSGVLPAVTSTTLINGSTFEFDICFDRCPYTRGPYQVGIVAFDDACSLPLFDTLKVTVNIQPPANAPATFTSPNVVAEVEEGTSVTPWKITGIDSDNDALVLTPYSQDAKALDNHGFTLTPISSQPGSVSFGLGWNTRCDQIDFSQKSEFNLKFLLDDADVCSIQQPDTMTLKLKLKLPESNKPIVDTNITPEPYEILVDGITMPINETLLFNVFGTDADTEDMLVLDVQGIDFNISDYSMSFPAVSGLSNVVSLFKWDIKCDEVNPNVKDEYSFEFIVKDDGNRCGVFAADTVTVTVNLVPPFNYAPLLTATNLNEDITFQDGMLLATLGDQIEVALTGVDKDKDPRDRLTLDLVNVTGNGQPVGYSFSRAEGDGSVESIFTWKPECNIFSDNVYENEYTFTFRVQDSRCFNVKYDSVDVNIRIKDIENDVEEFLPPNFISPNGDGLNDYFAMLKADANTGELLSILPKDNCSGRFEGIVIYNRWGGKVYESNDREFRWYANDNPTGIYYYTLTYANQEYKGIITVSYGESESNR